MKVAQSTPSECKSVAYVSGTLPVGPDIHVTAENRLRREAARLCILGKTFGCVDQPLYPPMMWVEGGCRGRFVCNGIRAQFADLCGFKNSTARQECPCDGERRSTQAELNSTVAFDDAQSWWQEQGPPDPGEHAENWPESEVEAIPPTRCELVQGIRHGYGAYLASAVARAWEVERIGRVPVLSLPGWLPSMAICTADWSGAVDGRMLGGVIRAHPHECDGRWLSCFTEPRRQCREAGVASTAPTTVWTERVGWHRPRRPIGGAPFWQVAEYVAALLQPNEAFERHLLRPTLDRVGAFRPALAVHLRYGDSCTAFEQNRTARRCDAVSKYVRAAAALHERYHFRSVVVSTDSARAEAAFRDQWGTRTRVFGSAVSTASARLGDAWEASGVVFESHIFRIERAVLEAQQAQAAHATRASGSADNLGQRLGLLNLTRDLGMACAEWARFADFMLDLHVRCASLQCVSSA